MFVRRGRICFRSCSWFTVCDLYIVIVDYEEASIIPTLLHMHFCSLDNLYTLSTHAISATMMDYNIRGAWVIMISEQTRGTEGLLYQQRYKASHRHSGLTRHHLYRAKQAR